MIQVTEPFLPPKEEYDYYLSEIWNRNWLTNNGPLVNELELQLKQYLDLKHLLYVTNGTIALQMAIKSLDIKGEVITTPFSYVATTSSLVWEGCSPVFVDIDEKTFNINPDLIEAAINKNTTAILATHVFGNPCEIEKIEKIARQYKLKIIYDAAHCFGVKYKGKSIFEYGDISCVSFHATKLFHTIEGGAVITKDDQLLKKMFHMRNFGHAGAEVYSGFGINGKNSEFHAAMGICNLKYISQILEKRKEDFSYYASNLQGLRIENQSINKKSNFNYAYYPILFESEKTLITVMKELEAHRVYSRRYFYPLLSDLEYVESKGMPIAKSVSDRILCLPTSYQITKSEIDLICRTIKRALKYSK